MLCHIYSAFSKGIAFLFLFSLPQLQTIAQSPAGIFEGRNDVGNVQYAGTVTYATANDRYELSGAGSNIWFSHDEFSFLWKKMKGDFILQARGHFIGKGVEAHRKFGWMVRSSLDSSAPMVSATVHGDGLTSLQYRKTTGDDVAEIKSDVYGPDVIQLERSGNTYIMSVAHFGELYSQEKIDAINLGDDVYAGLFVCSHNKDVVEKVSFDNVRIVVPAGADLVPYREYLGSHIETMDVQSGHRQILYSEKSSLQAPNWMRNGQSLIYNKDGLIYKLDLKNPRPVVINTGFVKNNNNDHVISFNGKMLGLSSASADPKYGSIVYTVPLQGGTPKQVTATGPSYLHGWSPDGKFLVFTGQRNNDFDIYKIPAGGGEEIRLTDATGLDDGPEYSPDGKYIYFNSVRSGTMQLWRMRPDGSQQEQLTNDDLNNWFPHISPNGKWIVFLSFGKDVKPDDHPFYKHVYLRMMPANGGQPRVISYLYGGQGTINTPSWSPDSQKIAFVSNSN
ncbi:MAG TPA: biopolymer transporter TolR [Chitinophagaceae bacterium]|nr:biopolymer transporter TolR [Chitinophagaceae bacterium]